jgi:DNA primase
LALLTEGVKKMSRYYPDSFLKEIKDKANIVDIVSSYTQVRQMGANHMAVCPFHSDQNPSMQVKPETNTFYCHGCAAGSSNHSKVKSSDVLSFIQHAHNLSFPDAVEMLAKLTNTPLPTMSREEQEKVNQERHWLEFCLKADHVFRTHLSQNEKALTYLANRGLTPLELETWRLGFGGEDLPNQLKNVKNRITFPLFDYQGNIVSFTGRVPFSSKLLEEINLEQKEKNLPEIVKYKDRYGFDKSNHLYGIHIAKDYIRQWRTAVVTEGWTDVISLHKHGIRHAVSTMGVALSVAQVKLMKRAGAEKAIIMRDGDVAGFLAAERDAKILLEHGIKPYVLALENGMDPDDLCAQFPVFDEGLSKYIHRHMQTVEQFKITRIYKQTQNDILYHYSMINDYQKERLEKVIPVLATIDDPIQLDIFIRQVSELFAISYEAINQKVKTYKQNIQQATAKQIAFA